MNGDRRSGVTRRRALAAAAAAAVFAPARLSAEPLNLRMAHSLPADHPVHHAMERFSSSVRERTGGEVRIQLFPDGVLGQELDLIGQVQAGKLDLAKASASVLETEAPLYRAFNLPFLFRDKAHWTAVVAGAVGETILASGVDVGYLGLTFYDAGARNFYGQRRIAHPRDLQGLKIRVQPSATMIRMIRLLDAVPAPMAWEVVYSALRTGLIDGAENNLTALVYGRHGEVVKHYSFTEHTLVPDVVLISARVWRQLPNPIRTALQEAAAESFRWQVGHWAEAERAARQSAEALGVAFTEVDKAPFMERVAPLRTDLANENDNVGALIQRIEALA
jgi:tripartite ATP-independent transporter DctP family solute receptor